MIEQPNPVKEYLFGHIEKSEEKFQLLFSQTKMAEIIDDILTNCFDKVSCMVNKEESIGVLITGILHYMLTNALIPSQRKVRYCGIDLDIVIPDLKTLEKDPKKTLVIYIAKTLNKNTINENLKQLKNIQPENQNIWIVSSQDLGFENTYVIQKEKSSFSNIVYDIGEFVNVKGNNKFKILPV